MAMEMEMEMERARLIVELVLRCDAMRRLDSPHRHSLRYDGRRCPARLGLVELAAGTAKGLPRIVDDGAGGERQEEVRYHACPGNLRAAGQSAE